MRRSDGYTEKDCAFGNALRCAVWDRRCRKWTIRAPHLQNQASNLERIVAQTQTTGLQHHRDGNGGVEPWREIGSTKLSTVQIQVRLRSDGEQALQDFGVGVKGALLMVAIRFF